MKKKFFNTAIVFIAVVVSGLGFGKDKSPLSAVDSVVWVGIDFSLVKMVQNFLIQCIDIWIFRKLYF